MLSVLSCCEGRDQAMNIRPTAEVLLTELTFLPDLLSRRRTNAEAVDVSSQILPGIGSALGGPLTVEQFLHLLQPRPTMRIDQ